MRNWQEWALRSVLTGVAATATMDVGAEIIRRATGVEPLNYGLVGRWIANMPRGTFAHESIATARPIAGERALGMAAHYSIGVAFAGLLLAASPNWGRKPTLVPALAVGIGSTAAPFLVMQPAFGLGIAASKTPNPPVARFRSLRAHGIYGIGLYLAGKVVSRTVRRGC